MEWYVFEAMLSVLIVTGGCDDSQLAANRNGKILGPQCQLALFPRHMFLCR
jgi:hypothetical protein